MFDNMKNTWKIVSNVPFRNLIRHNELIQLQFSNKGSIGPSSRLGQSTWQFCPLPWVHESPVEKSGIALEKGYFGVKALKIRWFWPSNDQKWLCYLLFKQALKHPRNNQNRWSPCCAAQFYCAAFPARAIFSPELLRLTHEFSFPQLFWYNRHLSKISIHLAWIYVISFQHLLL